MAERPKPKPTKPGKPIKTTSKYRSAITGRYVTKSHAKRYPKATVRETGGKSGIKKRKSK